MARPLLVASIVGLALAIGLGIVAGKPPASLVDLPWGAAHQAMGLFGFLLPGLAWMVWQIAGPRLPRSLPDSTRLAWLWSGGAVLLAVASLAQTRFAVVAAWIVLLGAGVLQTVLVLRASPRRGESVVDVARDPLTKGDDASLKHVRFAHMVFLPLSLAGLALASAPLPDGWAFRINLAAYHWLLAGFGLLCVYGLSHIIVPRLCGVPAIAAGAIKGELHSSLLGLVLLAAGFLAGSTALAIAGGAFLFFGAFVFMGVLGANIMKNKSPTQRVTPQFAYIPWTFAGVFWLVAGVLLGLFLAAATGAAFFLEYPDMVRSLRFVHVHAVLLGGFALLLMGFATRLAPQALGHPPTPFQRTKWAFYGFNTGLLLLLYGHLAHGAASRTFLAGGLLAGLSLAAWFFTLKPPVAARR